MNLTDDYRSQLSRYLCARDCDRIVPILLKPHTDRTDDDRAVLADAAGIIRHVKFNA